MAPHPKVFTPDFLRRLAHANQACRELRGHGYHVLACRVPPGASIEKSRIEVAGGQAADSPQACGCVITRRLGGAK